MKVQTANQEIQEKNTSKDYALDVLRNTFLDRKARNKSYSMTSYARDFGISTAVLSRILSGVRPLSMKLAMHMAATLELDEVQSKTMLLSVLKTQSQHAKISKKVKEKLEKELTDPVLGPPITYTNVDVEQFKAISQWYHLAILNMMTLEDFKMNPLWISKKLGISTTEVRDAWERLITLGLINETNGFYTRTKKNLFIQTSKSELAVRKFHDQMIDKAKEELRDSGHERFDKRLITGTTITCAKEHVPLIKEKIALFQKEILALTNTAPETELYQMNLQFFPLTKDDN